MSIGIEDFGDLAGAAQTAQAGRGQDNGVDVSIGNSRSRVSTLPRMRHAHQPPSEGVELGHPAGRAGADRGSPRPARPASDRPRADQRVARVVPQRYGGDASARRPARSGRSLYEWTAKSISFACSASRRAETNTPDPELLHRRVRAVAVGHDLDQFDRLTGGGGDLLGHRPRLRHRERAAAGAQLERHASAPGSSGATSTARSQARRSASGTAQVEQLPQHRHVLVAAGGRGQLPHPYGRLSAAAAAPPGAPPARHRPAVRR